MRIITCLLGWITVFLITSCDYKLQKKYLEYIPYNGNEILIFQSDCYRMDTIFLKGMDKYQGGGGMSFNTFQIAKLKYTRTDTNRVSRYFSGDLVKFEATKKGDSRISFDMTLNGARFYDFKSYGLSEFKKMPDSELTIGNKTYSDVKIFEADEFSKYYENRDNYVERFYWSFSEGFLGLDKKDEKWRLIKKIDSNSCLDKEADNTIEK